MSIDHRAPGADRSLCESIFRNLPAGLAYCQMVFDAQQCPIDSICIQANKEFEKITGSKAAVGRRMTEIFPAVGKSNPHIFEICGRASLAGKGGLERFEMYAEMSSKWFMVSVYSPRTEFFVALFQDITNEKQVTKYLTDAKIAVLNVLEDLQIEKETLAQVIAKDEAILSSVGDGLITTDPEGRILLANKIFETTLGENLEEVHGKFLSEVIPMFDKEGNAISKEERPIEKLSQSREWTSRSDYHGPILQKERWGNISGDDHAFSCSSGR
ncbi:MAG: PAS domain S-box protein [Patescibacteria group bacterium]